MATDNFSARDGTLERGWWPVSRVAKEYLHVNPDFLRECINKGELPAYQKPITRGRKDSTRHVVLINLDDVDAMVRAWPLASF